MAASGNDPAETLFARVKRKLGCRLRLVDATFPAHFTGGVTVSFAAHLNNDGHAGPIKARPVFLVSDDGTHRYDVPLSGATRVFGDYVLGGGGHPAYQDIKIPMAANGIDRAAPARLALGFRYGGTGTVTIDGISFR